MVKGIEKDGDGNIARLVLDDGRTLAGDFFVDCTGFRRQLIQKELDGNLDLTGANRPIDEVKAFEPGHYIATSPNLVAGRYLFVCTLSSTINGQVVHHFAEGMVAKLTIVARKKTTT